MQKPPDDELQRLLDAADAYSTPPPAAPREPPPRPTSTPEVDPDLELHWQQPETRPRRERQLNVFPDSFDLNMTRFVVEQHVLRLHELPDPLRSRFQFLLRRMKADGVQVLHYQDHPADELRMSEELPEDVRRLATDAIQAFHDAAWFVEYRILRSIAREHEKPWHCPDCGADVSHTKRWCDARDCHGREIFARATGEAIAAPVVPVVPTTPARTTQPETRRARRAH